MLNRVTTDDRLQFVVDAELCFAHGRCYALYPEWFAADDDGRSVVISLGIDGHEHQRAGKAVDCCPEQAIELRQS